MVRRSSRDTQIMKKPRQSEVVLGKRVVAWLQADGWDVYQEVQGYRGGSVADIVATKDGQVRVIELKASLSFELMAQANYWRFRSNEVFVAVPKAESSDGRNLAKLCFEWRGIGILEVHTPSHLEWAEEKPSDLVRVWLKSSPNTSKDFADFFLSKLRPEHKTFAEAGTASGGHFTEFKETCGKLRELALAEPGITITDAIKRIKHHYASVVSARQHLGTLIAAGKVRGLRAQRDEKKQLRIYPV